MSKIAFVGNTSFSLYVFRRYIIQEYLQNGHDVYCFCPEDNYTEKLKAIGITFIPIQLSRKGTSITEDLKFTWRMTKLYRKYNFDLVLHYTIKPNIYGSLAALLTKTKSYAFITGLGYTFINDNLTTKIARYLYKISLLFPEKVFFLNDTDKASFISKKLCPSHKAIVIPGEGVDTSVFNLPFNNRNRKKLSLIFVGRLLIDKGIGELLNATRQLLETGHPVELHIVGDTDPNYPLSVTRDAFLKIVRQYPDIHFHGYQNDVLPFLKKAHFLILPSYREGLSTVTIESMSARRPVLGSNVPGIQDIITHGEDGFLFTPQSTQSIYDTILKAMSLSDESYLSFSEKARLKIRRSYSIDQVKVLYDQQVIPFSPKTSFVPLTIHPESAKNITSL